MSKDVFQIIGNFLDSKDFYELKKLCGLSVDNYIKNVNVKVNEHHEYMDDLIKRNLIPNVDVIKYALQYDIPKYARLLMCNNNNIWITYKNAERRPLFSRLNTIPKIVKHSYKYHGFRFNQNHIDSIFEDNCVELMKIVQNYCQKSNISIEDYYAHNNDLWQLNYKHKIIHSIAKYRTCFCFLVHYLCAIPISAIFLRSVDWFNIGYIWLYCVTLILIWVAVTCISIYLCDPLLKAFANIKLPL